MNTIYENEIIENKMTDLLNTRLNTKSLMVVDTTLSENAGLRKVINRYTYNGKVEQLGKGEKNSVKGTVSFVPEYYDVKRYQQTFEYNDMDAMADPYIVDVAMQGAITEIANEINEEYVSEILKIGTRYAYEGESITYSDFVDALAKIDCEVDSELFIIMGAEARKEIRKDPDFISAKQGEIVYSGQFGTICGIPVLFSKLMPAGKIVITNKNAVRFFVKKSASVEQARDIETKDNTVVYERHGLIALVDDTNSVLIGKNPPTMNGWFFLENAPDGFCEVNCAADPLSPDYAYYFKFNSTPHFVGDIINTDEWEVFPRNGYYSMDQTKAGDTLYIVEVDKETNAVVREITYTYTQESLLED